MTNINLLRLPSSGLLLVISLAFAVSSCSIQKKNKKDEAGIDNSNLVTITDTSLGLMNITLAQPETKVISSNIYLNGKIVALPNFRASVTSDIEGKVERIYVREGDFVKRGQTLITLRSMAFIELQNQYFEAKSEFDFLSIEYKRQEELNRNNIGALVEFQTTESKLNASQSKMSALKAKLKLLGIDAVKLGQLSKNDVSSTVTIIAPIDGYLFLLPVNVGVLATTEMTLAELVNTNELMADVYAYDNDLDDVHEGQTVEIDFINHSFPSVKGTVVHISRAFDPETKSVRVHVRFVAPPGKLVLPDMSVRCVLMKNESNKPQLTVPVGAVLQEEDHHFIFLTFPAEKLGTENIIHKYRVTLGAQNEREVHIQFANEPNPGFLVVTKNAMIVENERKKKSGLVFE